jgi:hypothetical protein
VSICGHFTFFARFCKGEREFGALMVPDLVILNTKTRNVAGILRDTQ